LSNDYGSRGGEDEEGKEEEEERDEVVGGLHDCISGLKEEMEKHRMRNILWCGSLRGLYRNVGSNSMISHSTAADFQCNIVPSINNSEAPSSRRVSVLSSRESTLLRQ
jgi:hypothetical protein